jgi:hypothetical protein
VSHPAYRYLVLNSATRRVVAELPALAVSFGDVLNNRGAFSVTLPLTMPEVPVSLADLDPPRALFVVERAGIPLWAGWVWTWEADLAADTLTLNGEGWLSILGRAIWTGSLSYTATEQSAIMAAIIDAAQARSPYAAVGIDTSRVLATGVERTHSVGALGTHTVEERLMDLCGSSLSSGVDFVFLPRWDDTGALAVDFYAHPVPNLGRDSGLTLTLGSNADLLSITGDGSATTYSHRTVGAGDEHTALLATASAEHLTAASVLVESATVHSDTETAAALQSLADRHLAIHSQTILIPRVRVTGDLFGSFIVGDRVQVQGTAGLVSLDGSYRITGWDASLDASSEMLVDLTLAPVAAFLP